MKVEKKGQLEKIVMINDGVNASFTAHLRFNDGVAEIIIPQENPSVFLNEIIKKYDLGFANAATPFVYCDFNSMVFFSCSLWSDTTNVLNVLLPMIDKEKRALAEDICNGLSPNCDIVNCGFTFDDSMNSLHLTSDIPEELKDNKLQKEYDLSAETCIFRERLMKSSQVAHKDNVVIFYSNDYGNEGWNGPQCYGGITWLNAADASIKDEYEYDFDLSLIEEDGRDFLWDTNTVVELRSGKDYDIHVLCHYKDIENLKEFNNSNLLTGICSDISLLSEGKMVESVANPPKHSVYDLIFIRFENEQSEHSEQKEEDACTVEADCDLPF